MPQIHTVVLQILKAPFKVFQNSNVPIPDFAVPLLYPSRSFFAHLSTKSLIYQYYLPTISLILRSTPHFNISEIMVCLPIHGML